MSDEADLGNERAERLLGLSLARISTQPEATPTGVCLNCGEPVSELMRWCDTDCRNDWSKHVRP